MLKEPQLVFQSCYSHRQNDWATVFEITVCDPCCINSFAFFGRSLCVMVCKEEELKAGNQQQIQV